MSTPLSIDLENPVDIGEVIDGRYRVVRKMGSGGMGAVYEAEQINLRRQVALKVLRPEVMLRDHSGNAVRRFVREARAASAIKHTNVVDIIDVGECDGKAYYVMEFLRGHDLSSLLKQEGRLNWERARGILVQVLRALKAAHDRGIIHRDIKPANTFLVEPEDEDVQHDRVKVLDFGIAKLEDSSNNDTEALTATSEILGTATYMSPEQAQGQPADVRSDVYAVGVLAYKMLTGTVPFTGENTFQVLIKHTMVKPLPLRHFVPDLDPGVEQLVLKALAKDPDERHLSARAFIRAIAELGPVPLSTSDPSIPIEVSNADNDATTRVSAVSATVEPSPVVGSTPGSGPGRTQVQTHAPPQSTVNLGPFQRPVSATVPSIPVEPGPEPAGLEVSTGPIATDHPRQMSRPWLGAVIAVLILLGMGSGYAVMMALQADDAGAVHMKEVVEPPVRPTPKSQDPPSSASAGAPQDTQPDGPPPSHTPTDIPRDSDLQEPLNDKSEPSEDATSSPPAQKAKPNKSQRAQQRRPFTDANVKAAFRRKAKRRCEVLGRGQQVTVEFSVGADGKVMMPRAKDPHTKSDIGKCMVGVISKAKFPGTGTMRPLSLRIDT